MQPSETSKVSKIAADMTRDRRMVLLVFGPQLGEWMAAQIGLGSALSGAVGRAPLASDPRVL